MQDDELQTYQDDLTTDENAADPLMQEGHDDPTRELGIPPEEFKSELDDLATDEGQLGDREDDDAEARIEDLDEDPEGND